MNAPPTASLAVMTPAAKSVTRAYRGRRWLWLLRWIAAAILIVIALTATRVALQGSRDEARQADAIVVFGAAEYAGRPSPVYRARLDHAYDLFQRGLAQFVITTGGSGADPTFSEGGVGRDYLARRGIPDRCLIAETQSDDTAESAERVSAILRTNQLHTVLAVSDAYHMFRIKQLLTRQGVVTYGSPRSGSIPHAPASRLAAAVREAVSYCLWRISNL